MKAEISEVELSEDLNTLIQKIINGLRPMPPTPAHGHRYGGHGCRTDVRHGSRAPGGDEAVIMVIRGRGSCSLGTGAMDAGRMSVPRAGPLPQTPFRIIKNF